MSISTLSTEYDGDCDGDCDGDDDGDDGDDGDGCHGIGFNCEFVYAAAPKPRPQAAQADEDKVPVTIWMGADELKRGGVTVKRMAGDREGSGKGEFVTRANLIAHLSAVFAAQQQTGGAAAAAAKK
jgi:hypothetical protein